nr:DUF2500 family protein [uncultured Moellerella sp.]
MNKPILLIIVLAIIGVLATKRFFDQREQNIIDDNSAERHFAVVVENKRDYPYPNMRSRERDVVSPETFRYEIDFRPLVQGDTIKVILKDEAIYLAIEKNSKGTLYMQGSRFIRFEPE